MQINAELRTVHLSVGDFAGFSDGLRGQQPGHPSGPWRMAVGQAWHNREHEILKTEGTAHRTESPISGRWQSAGWTFQLSGRIDQILEGSDHCKTLREIKTVRQALPCDVPTLERDYRAYFAQIACYLCLTLAGDTGADRAKTAGELLLIDIDSGLRQKIDITERAEAIFEAQIKKWIPFLQSRERSWKRRRSLQFKPAFTELRDGQAELKAALQKAAPDRLPILLEAPTGFGKTGILLEYALEQLKNGLFDRVILLSSKSTGQLEIIRQLAAMAGDGLNYLQMRNRTEHAEGCFCGGVADSRVCQESLANVEADGAPEAETLFKEGTFPVSTARAEGNALRICPYALTRYALPHAEVWVGDLNYIFDPASRSTFEHVPGYAPEKTLLLVDEAHNLPERIASALSLTLRASDVSWALSAVTDAGGRWKDRAAILALLNFLEDLEPSAHLSAEASYGLLDALEAASDCVKASPLPYAHLATPVLDVLFNFRVWVERLSAADAAWLCWSPEQATVELTCLDAGPWIQAVLKPFGKAVLMSATLSPADAYAQACGLAELPYHFLQGETPWRAEAYRVALDLRVDTRFKQRSQHYATTAKTIAAACFHNSAPPIAVFFPSFQYAKNILEYLGALEPGLRVALQPRGGGLAEQSTFIEESLLMSDALFLILGSSYAEGIDQLGGQVALIIVVSPALPEVNTIQNARLDAQEQSLGNRSEAFRSTFVLPGMRKILQALGRVVRAPGHKAAVLLHCKRFAEDAYLNELMPPFTPTARIKDERSLLEWLEQ